LISDVRLWARALARIMSFIIVAFLTAFLPGLVSVVTVVESTST
jgi:hypothetical protein